MSSDEVPVSRPPPFLDPTSDQSYELTGKIMMSAIIIVFTVVVVMVLLHIYARCYVVRNHRRRRRRTHLVFYVDPADSAADAASSRGLDSSLLKSLPTFVYSSELKENVQECAVCLSEFEAGEKGRLLPKCNHSFHLECIDMWFHSHSTCPLCRTTVDGKILSQTKASDESQLPVEIVVELSELSRRDSNHHDSETAYCRPEPSSSSSFGAKRKGLDLVRVPLDIPARTANFSFPNSDELSLSSPTSQGLRSSTSRLMSFKRILSREKKPIPSPSSSSGVGTSCAELTDTEDGRVETRTSRSRAPTPR